MKVKMTDVAKMAGVSVATVSHVINETHFVSEERATRVRRAISELGYSPNVSARNLKTGRKNLIGFIVPDISNSYFSTLIEKVESVVAQKNYNLIVANTKESPESEIRYIRTLSAGIVDGLAVASTLEKIDDIFDILPIDFPLVLVDRAFPECKCTACTISCYSAVYHCVSDLISQGHVRIGYIAGVRHISTTAERLRAYEQALADHHIPVDDALVCYGNSMSNGATPCVKKLLEEKCTAIFVSNNIMTFDVLNYLNFNQIQVPADVAVAGFGDYNYASFIRTMIPTVVEPVAELGDITGKSMLESLNSETEDRRVIRENILYGYYTNNFFTDANHKFMLE